MVFLPVIAAAVALGLLLGGRLSAIAEVNVRAIGLFYVAILIQIVAFPSGALPWSIGDGTARVLWLVSYACLGAAAVANRQLRGAPVVALGMLLNLVAIVANNGHMPALPHALREAGIHSQLHNNSIASAEPNLSWLVDRWATPGWIPLGNVYSIGDVILAVGAFVLVLSAMKVSRSSPLRVRLGRA
jgi:uncharacterized protein DUF5317